MSLPTTFPTAILETVLTRLAPLFLIGARGDTTAARDAAAQMLAAYHPETVDQLRLAAKIVGFSFQALEALSQAATPDMPLTRTLRLRSGAVSLSREAAKAERRLGQLQTARQQPIQAQQAEPDHSEPKIDKALALIADTGDITVAAKASNLTWTQAYEQRQRDARIAASLKRAELRIAAQASAAIAHSPDQRPVAQVI
jgi:hypothetical protein